MDTGDSEGWHTSPSERVSFGQHQNSTVLCTQNPKGNKRWYRLRKTAERVPKGRDRLTKRSKVCQTFITYTDYPRAGANPSWHWVRGGVHPVDRPPVHYTDTQPFTLIHRKFRFTKQTCTCFDQEEETWPPGEKTHRHRKNMQTPQRKAPAVGTMWEMCLLLLFG